MDEFLRAAIEEAKKGLAEGGIPIGSVLVIDGKIAGRGHNRRIQKGSAILHAEMDALENAGRLLARDYQRATAALKPGALYPIKLRTVIRANILGRRGTYVPEGFKYQTEEGDVFMYLGANPDEYWNSLHSFLGPDGVTYVFTPFGVRRFFL